MPGDGPSPGKHRLSLRARAKVGKKNRAASFALLLVALLVKVDLLLDLFLGKAGGPLVIVGLHHAGGHTWHESLGFRDEFGVENFGDFEETVPLRVVRPHHRGAHAGAAAGMMPKVVIGPLDFFVEWRG